MRLSGLLSRRQVEQIHANVLKVLEEVGVQVEHLELRKRLSTVGGRAEGERVRFPGAAVERQIWDAPRGLTEWNMPRVEAGCAVYKSLYLAPATDGLKPFDENLLAMYFGLAESLNVKHLCLLGVPLVPGDIPVEYLPCAEKLYAWKYGASPGGSVHLTKLCQPLLEMFEVHASAVGKPVEKVFSAAGYLISPLKLARPECEQVLFFSEHGLRMSVGHMPSQGGAAPVTFAGCLTLALAEQVFLFLLDRALWGDVEFRLGAMVTTVDMRTGVSRYGRPERNRINLAFADIADFYECSCTGHCGCTDACMPSYEAGVQKATGTLITALATGYGYVEAGLLGMDEICSPVQLVLDCDLARSLAGLLAEAAVSDEECALDEILAAGIGGSHLGTDFTAAHFRSALFEPLTWSGRMVGVWQSSGMRADVDAATDIVTEFERGFVPASRISEEEERELRAIVTCAAKRSTGGNTCSAKS